MSSLKEEGSIKATTADKSPAAPSKNPAAAGIDFTEVYSLLTKHQQSSNSLFVPLNDPTLNQILDLLTVQGIEKLACKRWDDMTSRIGSATFKGSDDKEEKEEPTEQEKWISLQRTPYKKYEELHKLESEAADDDDLQESSNCVPNHLTPERFGKLRNAGVAMNKWEMRLMELKKYHEERGNCDVPIEYPGVRFLCLLSGCF